MTSALGAVLTNTWVAKRKQTLSNANVTDYLAQQFYSARNVPKMGTELNAIRIWILRATVWWHGGIAGERGDLGVLQLSLNELAPAAALSGRWTSSTLLSGWWLLSVRRFRDSPFSTGNVTCTDAVHDKAPLFDFAGALCVCVCVCVCVRANVRVCL